VLLSPHYDEKETRPSKAAGHDVSDNFLSWKYTLSQNARMAHSFQRAGAHTRFFTLLTLFFGTASGLMREGSPSSFFSFFSSKFFIS
jgi:hypothetical protein